jgi:hypothetical protein
MPGDWYSYRDPSILPSIKKNVPFDQTIWDGQNAVDIQAVQAHYLGK